MKCRIKCIFPLLILMFISACAPVTMEQFLADGREPLSEDQIYELIADHGLHLEAIDFDANVQFLSNGHLTAAGLQGEQDKGKWSIVSGNQLCIKFELWYFGDLKCYKLVQNNDKYLFFTTNGARYYTGTPTPGSNSLPADKDPAEKDTHRYQRQSVAEVAPLSNEDKKHTLISLARNCPDCNFAGVDLREAQLIGANLAGTNLSGADLRDANLRRANLVGANLTGANLTRTNLAGANLSDCDLTDADLTGSNLISATVTGAIFKGATLSGAHLESIKGFKE